MNNAVKAPFDDLQVASINSFQTTAPFHKLTCGKDSRHGNLTAYHNGLFCSVCDYVQVWVPEIVTDWSWDAKVYKPNV